VCQSEIQNIDSSHKFGAGCSGQRDVDFGRRKVFNIEVWFDGGQWRSRAESVFLTAKELLVGGVPYREVRKDKKFFSA